MTAPGWTGGAELSHDRRYRYVLTRRREPSTPAPRSMTWVMLNPSTADEDLDDATIRKCTGFAARWGFERYAVVNLFAYRATKPADLLLRGRDVAIGPENDDRLLEWCRNAALVVVAWGTWGRAYERGAAVGRMLLDAGIELRAIDVVKSGQPAHPLMLPYSLEPSVAWRPEMIR
ncbi:MAG TPA: DUF1643 domain-containing protein [Gaiellaceae bacterium]|nr:DUF1643 domain-containing protein [Gaiellaceae bacterium]